MKRSKKFNKYTLTKYDSLEERLKRSNPSLLERIAKMAEKFEKAYILTPKEIYAKQKLDRADLQDESKTITLADIYNSLYKEDNNENREESNK